MKFAQATPAKPPGPFARIFIGRIFPLIFILVGGAVLWHGAGEVIKARESLGWPTVPGVVVESKVVSSSSDNGTSYSPRVGYAYTIADTEYVAKRIAFGDYGSSDPARAKGIVARYPVGAKISVRHAPGEPGTAVLEPGVSAKTWFLPGFGLIFLLAGSAMAVLIPRSLKKQAEAASGAIDGNSADTTTEIPSGKNLPGEHPKVVRRDSPEGVVIETGGGNLLGAILLAVAVGQIVFIGVAFRDSLGTLMIIPFAIADSLMLLGGAFVLASRYRITVGPDAVSLFYGRGRIGRTWQIGRTSPMAVTLAFRGAKKNDIPQNAVVVTNGAGEEIHFGSFLDDSRKTFIAGHLAKLLRADSRDRANPFK